MPLVQTTLNTALEKAFSEAMLTYQEVGEKAVKDGKNVADIAPLARLAAAKKFAEIATPAIDAYIKSASVQVTIPSGLVTQGSSTASAPNLLPLPIFGIPGDLISTGGLT